MVLRIRNLIFVGVEMEHFLGLDSPVCNHEDVCCSYACEHAHKMRLILSFIAPLLVASNVQQLPTTNLSGKFVRRDNTCCLLSKTTADLQPLFCYVFEVP